MLYFELPFHDMCVSRTAVLSYLDNTIEVVYFDFVRLEKCPDVIINSDGRFRYCGVSGGQARYKQEVDNAAIGQEAVSHG